MLQCNNDYYYCHVIDDQKTRASFDFFVHDKEYKSWSPKFRYAYFLLDNLQSHCLPVTALSFVLHASHRHYRFLPLFSAIHDSDDDDENEQSRNISNIYPICANLCIIVVQMIRAMCPISNPQNNN